MSSGWSKGAAGIAALLIAGAGVNGINESNKRDERGTGYREAAAQQGAGGAAAARDAGAGRHARRRDAPRAVGGRARRERVAARRERRPAGPAPR